MAPAFHQRLLEWWRHNGRKDLPWQHPRSPYRVWISEIMLQQTQVTTVIPYFERWMQSFPDLESLANAELDEVLAQWAGLGYYARARNLHKAARICVADHEGSFPLDRTTLLSLPGIGESTANAIISQATDQPAAVLDGNVRRVLARHAGIEGWTGSTAVQKKLWAEAEARLPATNGADYSQAVMDLGALICTRSSPACDLCPVSEDCIARETGRVDALPSPKPKTRVSRQDLHMLILADPENRVLLEQRAAAGIWGGLWSLPTGESLQQIEEALGMTVEQPLELPPVDHRLSHVQMHIQPWAATSGLPKQVKCTTRQRWVDAGQWAEFGMPRPVDDLLRKWNQGAFS